MTRNKRMAYALNQQRWGICGHGVLAILLIKSTNYIFIDGVRQQTNTMSLHVSIEIFDALHELLRIFRARMRQSLESVSPDLTFGELRVLMHVGEHPDCAQKALVERCHVDKAQMARLLAQLEDKGWLTRSESTKDRRVRQLHLSTQGQRLFRQLGARRAELAAELLKDCPAPVQSQLLELLAQARDSALQAPSTDS